MLSKRLKLVGPLIVWTVFVWASRIRNVWTDDSLTTQGQVVRTVIAIIFLSFAVAAARVLWVRRNDDLGRGDRALLGSFVVWTVGFWLVRGLGIIVDDHSASFTAIHTVLMLISWGLSWLAWSAVSGKAGAHDAMVGDQTGQADSQATSI